MSAASTQSAVIRPRVSARRAVESALTLVAVVACVTLLVIQHESGASDDLGYQRANAAALARVDVPAGFDRTPSTWGCLPGPGVACYTSPQPARAAAHRLARSLGATGVTPYAATESFPAHYVFCAPLGDASAQVLVASRPTNAVHSGSLWLVPDGQDATYDGAGSAVTLTVTPCRL